MLFFVMLTLLSVVFFIGKGIPLKKAFLLMFCYTHVSKRHFYGKRKEKNLHLFSVTNEKC